MVYQDRIETDFL